MNTKPGPTRAPATLLALVLAVAFAALCSSCGSDRLAGLGVDGPQIVAVHYGRLVDVYGLRRDGVLGTTALEPYERDVLVSPDLADQRPPGSTRPDAEVLYDFLRPDPDTLQARLLIAREIGTSAFLEAFLALGSDLSEIAPAHRARDPIAEPFPVVPRNAALRITFDRELGVDPAFFVARDQNGRIVGLANPDAVQLLEIVPVAGARTGAGEVRFERVPVRVVARGRRLVVDPVLLGTEAVEYGVPAAPTGLPASPDRFAASVRLALPLVGTLAIPALQERDAGLVDVDVNGVRSAVRDFRAGNDLDRGAGLARGFLPDSAPPRLCGEIPMVLAAVGARDGARQVVTVFKNGQSHDIDREDVLRLHDPDSGAVFARGEVLEDPDDDHGRPAEPFVRVTITAIEGLADLDPRRRPDYPADPLLRERWLAEHAPRAVLVAEYSAVRHAPDGTLLPGDDPVNFVRFGPSPLPLAGGEPSPPNQNVSPFAYAAVRFSEPVDLASVKSLDSLFFATRDLLDLDLIEQTFLRPRGIDPTRFNQAKFRTPHLVGSRIVDEDGAQSCFRLVPQLGFYLDQEMRQRDAGRAFEDQQLKYYLHVLGGPDGVRDLAGNELDLGSDEQSDPWVVVPFALDLRVRPDGRPMFEDNQVVYLARRFADIDEDEQPSLYRGEVPRSGSPLSAAATPLPDLFGAVTCLADGRLLARPTARITRVVDDLNQVPPPSQQSVLRHCPWQIAGEPQYARPTASMRFGAPLSTPLNRAGARLQSVWREIDLSLSRLDSHDFNLDVEQMYWAPFEERPIVPEAYPRVSLFLGHAEFRPEPCLGNRLELPSMPSSGLQAVFADNYLHDLDPVVGFKETTPPPHPAYVDAQLRVDPVDAISEPNGIHRYLPLPAFEPPYFVWRDETVAAQGGNSGQGADVRNANQTIDPYIVSPWLGGAGRRLTDRAGGGLDAYQSFWGNFQEFWLTQTTRRDQLTGGGVGSIALPLLTDFWTLPELGAGGSVTGGGPPEGPSYRGPGDVSQPGANGWQVALALGTSPTPNFRVYSAGFPGAGAQPPIPIGPENEAWARASGGFYPNGSRTGIGGDNTVLWLMVDFLKRRTIATAGFAEILDPHRMRPRLPGTADPRLGPYFPDAGGTPSLPDRVQPSFAFALELPGGTPARRGASGPRVAVEFRAASRVDDEPWRWRELELPAEQKPDADNFPLDPQKACDAHIRKYDDRPVGEPPEPRAYWAYYYNRQVTDYTPDVQELMDPGFLRRFCGPHEAFGPRDVRYVNWRFVMDNDVAVTPPVTASIESFVLAYRFERR